LPPPRRWTSPIATLDVLRGDSRFGPHSWLNIRIEPRGPEMFLPVFGDEARHYRANQVVDVAITVTPVGPSRSSALHEPAP
jgi:hypothetical protein